MQDECNYSLACFPKLYLMKYYFDVCLETFNKTWNCFISQLIQSHKMDFCCTIFYGMLRYAIVRGQNLIYYFTLIFIKCLHKKIYLWFWGIKQGSFGV